MNIQLIFAKCLFIYLTEKWSIFVPSNQIPIFEPVIQIVSVGMVGQLGVYNLSEKGFMLFFKKVNI